jgi:hypothetical protein
MPGLKKELLQLQVRPRGKAHAEPLAEPIRNYRKILVFSPDRYRLAAAVESLSDCGHRSVFTAVMEQLNGLIENREVGFIILDGDKIDLDALDGMLHSIALLRPDIYLNDKIHVFSVCPEISDVRRRFAHAGGIKPLEY